MTEPNGEPRPIDQSANPFLNWLLGLSIASLAIGVLVYMFGNSQGTYYDSDVALRATAFGIAGSLDMWGTLGLFMFLLGRGITWRPARPAAPTPVRLNMPDTESSPAAPAAAPTNPS